MDSVSLDELRNNFLAFEVASCDSQGSKNNVFGAFASLLPVEDEMLCIEEAVTGVKRAPGRPNSSAAQGDTNPGLANGRCSTCARQHAPERKACPAREMVFWECHIKGHLAKCCRKSKDRLKRPSERENEV